MAGKAEGLYFRQLLAGRDFAAEDRVAQMMANFTYLIGDRASGEALIVDPAYAIDELIQVAGSDGMSITGALVTHFHPDHIGGDMAGYPIEGARELLDRLDVPLHVNEEEKPWVQGMLGIGDDSLEAHKNGDTVKCGALEVELVHTPGHTPGSQCFYLASEGIFVSGDTLFLDGCGRTDLPGGDPTQMYETLLHRLTRFPDTSVVYPGHLYSEDASRSLGDTRRQNAVFSIQDPDSWLAAFGNAGT